MSDQRDRMTAIVAQGRAEGAFPNLPAGDDRISASLLMAVFEGLMVQYAMDPAAFDMEEYAIAVFAWLGMTPRMADDAAQSSLTGAWPGHE
jgi:hypothetical protein